jgi:anti-sigma factor RsiW
MTTDLATHPTPDDLTGFALGRLDGDAERAVERHLGEYEACQNAAAQAPADSFVSLLRSATRFGDTSVEAKAGDVTLVE